MTLFAGDDLYYEDPAGLGALHSVIAEEEAFEELRVLDSDGDPIFKEKARASVPMGFFVGEIG